MGHAPRERVSWNKQGIKKRDFEDRHAPRERVSWNENSAMQVDFSGSHAPRERVSWNRSSRKQNGKLVVTLHVSVWVEIKFFGVYISEQTVTLHVSVWVEILCSISDTSEK